MPKPIINAIGLDGKHIIVSRATWDALIEALRERGLDITVNDVNRNYTGVQIEEIDNDAKQSTTSEL